MVYLSNESEELMFSQINERLNYMSGRKYPDDIATTLSAILRVNFDLAGLKPVFVGVYKRDPQNPRLTYPSAANTGGLSDGMCTALEGGIIGRAIRTGTDQYVPSVHADPDHHACDESMGGTELVLLGWPEKPFSNGKYEGKIVPVGVLDIDLNREYALSRYGVASVAEIWRKYTNQIFPGEAPFQPIEDFDSPRNP